jgi:hypothetical protein
MNTRKSIDKQLASLPEELQRKVYDFAMRLEQGVVSGPMVGNLDVDASVRWGVAIGPALWPTVLRILFVIDGRINTSFDPMRFGLGYVLQTLRDNSFAWWVQFHVQVVRRDANILPGFSATGDTNYDQPGALPPRFATRNFRFTEPNFSFDDWDQVWFFADYPANEPGDINEPQFCPLEDDELKLLADWMDRGGGVFAAGDHSNLGASMCSRIPRVRTMRRWTLEQGVPSQDGANRHETLQPGPGYEDVWEGDTIPQPVEVVYRQWTSSILNRPLSPHPLLTTTTGVIDKFPDHMHEGDVVADTLVELDRPLDIPGYNRAEYPTFEPPVKIAFAVGSPLTRSRPVPHIVGYGQTTNPNLPQTVSTGIVASARVARSVDVLGVNVLPGMRFGLVGAYDGDGVGIGRVVVDSTWHHWFSYNLHGFYAAAQPLQPTARLIRDVGANVVDYRPSPMYGLMQTYYRNVALWLATPAQRQTMLFAALWGIVVSDPMAFPAAPARSLWAVGKRAIDVASRTISQSMLFDFVGSFFGGRTEEIFGAPYDLNPADPHVASVPSDLAVRAIVGGIASSLIRPAFDYLQAKGKSRRPLDPDAVARHASDGVKQGHRALLDALQSSAAASKVIVRRLEEVFRPSTHAPKKERRSSAESGRKRNRLRKK